MVPAEEEGAPDCQHAGAPAPTLTPENVVVVKRCFGGTVSSLDQAFAALDSDGGDFALETLKTLSKMSPLSLRLTWEAIERHKNGRIVVYSIVLFFATRWWISTRGPTSTWSYSSGGVVLVDKCRTYPRR